MFDLDKFVNEYVTKRNYSMFDSDIESNREVLSRNIKDKTVLVIGGAGSIGSSFIKALLPFEPASLVVVDINENGLAELTRDLRSTRDIFVPKDYITYPMDYISPVFRKMFRKRGGFDIVANFSAHKHVRSEKDIFSVEALIRNNVLNAKILLDILSEYPPKTYFCVSTDKAANPVNVMGASKRIMEDLIFSYSDKFPVKTARFANVAFSNGSLPKGFLDRMGKLQPISAPNDVKRYFVSLEESGQICMLACILGANREVFFPKLQEEQMTTFDEIAKDLLRENGYEVLECESDKEAIDKAIDLENGSRKYPVHFSTSETSGEKGYEEFFTGTEQIDLKRLSSLGVIIGKEMPDRDRLEATLECMITGFNDDTLSKSDVIRIIKHYLPNFEHLETKMSLDEKM